MHPFMLDLRDRPVLVVGGGRVATRKVLGLLRNGATHIRVVAAAASNELRELEAENRIELAVREFVAEDTEGAWLVIAATDRNATNQAIAAHCDTRRIFCVNAGDSPAGSATGMVEAELPNGTRAAFFGNHDPGRAIAIRDFISTIARLGSIRAESTRTTGASTGGRVVLVGAGPGDPSLLTLRAVQAISEATTLVVDRLAPSVIWDDPKPCVTVIDVGKSPGKHAASQDEINRIIVTRAQAGERVARIKGGDPFVLGRGGEEAAACITAGVPVEVIPGITSAIAVPAAAGIPVTQRGVTSTFIVASAHEGPEGVLRAVADAPHSSTLALLMGASALPRIAAALIETGRAPDTPVAVLGSGWTANATTDITNLAEAAAGHVQVPPPAVVVIGEVVRMHDILGTLATATAKSSHA